MSDVNVVPTEITVREGAELHKAVAAALLEDEVKCELTQAELEDLMVEYGDNREEDAATEETK